MDKLTLIKTLKKSHDRCSYHLNTNTTNNRSLKRKEKNSLQGKVSNSTGNFPNLWYTHFFPSVTFCVFDFKICYLSVANWWHAALKLLSKQWQKTSIYQSVKNKRFFLMKSYFNIVIEWQNLKGEVIHKIGLPENEYISPIAILFLLAFVIRLELFILILYQFKISGSHWMIYVQL